jgi:hypothetical protein
MDELYVTAAGNTHGRMAKGGHGLPKLSPGPAMPDHFMPCGRATPNMAVSRVARPQAERPAAIFTLLEIPRRMPMEILSTTVVLHK